MCVRADRDQFPAHLFIACKDIRQRVKIPESLHEWRCVDLQRDAFVDQLCQNRIDPVGKRRIRIELVPVGQIPRSVIEMTA